MKDVNQVKQIAQCCEKVDQEYNKSCILWTGKMVLKSRLKSNARDHSFRKNILNDNLNSVVVKHKWHLVSPTLS